MISEQAQLARWPAGPFCENQLEVPKGTKSIKP